MGLADKEKAAAIKSRRVARKRNRDQTALDRRQELTEQVKHDVLKLLETSEDAVFWAAVDMTDEALQFLREQFTVTPHYVDDEEYHSLWRID